MTRMFPSRTRALLEQQSEANLPDVCDVLARTKVRQPGGVVLDTFKEVQWDVPCHLAPASLQVRGTVVVATQVTEPGKWQVRVPRGTSIPTDGQVRVRVLETGETVLLTVDRVLAPRSEEAGRLFLATQVVAKP